MKYNFSFVSFSYPSWWPFFNYFNYKVAFRAEIKVFWYEKSRRMILLRKVVWKKFNNSMQSHKKTSADSPQRFAPYIESVIKIMRVSCLYISIVCFTQFELNAYKWEKKRAIIDSMKYRETLEAISHRSLARKFTRFGCFGWEKCKHMVD